MRRFYFVVLMLGCVAKASAQYAPSEGDGVADTSLTSLEAMAEEDEEPDPPEVVGPYTLKWTTSIRYDLERRAGYLSGDSTAFHGPPAAFRSRVQLRVGTYTQAVFVVDQDAGEELGTTKRPIDFCSASIEFSNIGPVKVLAVGAIRPRFGLGLVMWSGRRAARLAASPSSFMRPRGALHVDSGAYEASTNRGIGIDLKVNATLQFVAFVAATARDAVVDGSGAVTSMPETGLHRNDGEIARDDRLAGRLAGGSIFFDGRSLAAGISFVSGYTHLPVTAGPRPYQIYRYTGRTWRGGSLFMRASFGRRLQAAGEVAVDDDGTPASLLVARSEAAPGLWIFSSMRDYPPRFNAVYGAVPGGAGSTSGNERGWIVGLEGGRADTRLRIYRDLFRKPWLQSDSYRPETLDSWGIEFKDRFDTVDLVLRFDSRVANRESSSKVVGVAPFQKRDRMRVRLDMNPERTLRPSIDLVFVRFHDDATETGEGIGQRLVWTVRRRFAVTAGVVFFRCDSGDSGIYLYEPDLPDYFSVPLLSDSGERVYILIRLGFSTAVTGWLKGGLTRWERERSVGSGVDEVTTSRLRSVSFALRFLI